MTTSARNRPVAAGVIRIIKNVDDYTDTVFNRITYPIDASETTMFFVDGSEVNNISGVCDILTPNAGGQINTSEMVITFTQLTQISGYPTS